MLEWSLRISVLEQCQLACGYCLPAKAHSASKKLWMRADQYDRVARVFSRFKLKKIRFTGGEPLLRSELPEIVSYFAAHCQQSLLSLTTNGLAFASMGLRLKNVGLSSLTFHLDTLRPDRYQKVMGCRGDLSVVLANIKLAQELGFKLKLNMVVQRGLNSDELTDFLLWSQDWAIELRFIELMNTGSAPNFVRERFISAQEILGLIGPVNSLGRIDRSDPAELFYWRAIKFGLIASDTRPFCDNCNRLRLSSSAKLYGCLYDPDGFDVGFMNDDSEEEIFERIKARMTDKSSFHPMLNKPRRLFSMAQTGG